MPDQLPSAHLIAALAKVGITRVSRLDLWKFFTERTGGAISGSIPPDMTVDRLAELAIQLARIRQ
jgi:hypothetical protein